MSLIGVKTEKGQRVVKDRSTPLTPRQRSAFILCDGVRSVDEVLRLTQASGVTVDDILHLFQEDLLAQLGGAASPSEPVATSPPLSVRSRQQRYQDAYPIAIRLTASLGLRGFRLNLAVEAADGFDQLKELVPRIKEAVGAQACAPLERAIGL